MYSKDLRQRDGGNMQMKAQEYDSNAHLSKAQHSS